MSQDQSKSSGHPREMISAYLDGQLDAQDRVRVFEHLRGCDACRWLLSDYRALATAARREEAPPVPADLADRIGRRIDADPAARFAWGRRLYTSARLPLATAAAVLVLVSLWIVWRGRLPGERLAEAPATEIPQPAVTVPPPPSPSPDARPSPAALAPAPAPEPNIHREAVAPAQASPKAERQAAATGKDRKIAEAAIGLEEKPTAAPAPSAIPPPEEEVNRLQVAAEPAPTSPGFNAPGAGQAGTEAAAAIAHENTAEAGQKQSADQVPAPAPGAVARATAGGVVAVPTLIVSLPEGRVTILPDSHVTLASGDYLCALAAGDPSELAAIEELRGIVARGVATGGPAAAAPPAAGEGAAVGIVSGRPAASGTIVVPAPPATGPLPPDLAAQLHARLRALLRERLLSRAEAQCGPAPPALQQIR